MFELQLASILASLEALTDVHVFWVGVALTAIAGTLLTISEVQYMRNIIRRVPGADPNPFTWWGWAIGALFVLYGSASEATGFTWSGAYELMRGTAHGDIAALGTVVNLAYLVIILVCTTLIAWFATTIGKGKRHLGMREIICGILLAVGVLALAGDAIGLVNVPWWGVWGVFAAGILIDVSAWYPLYRGVVERPEDEVGQLWPWRLTVWSAAFNLIAIFPNVYVSGQFLWTALVFALYYYTVNTMVLHRLEHHAHRARTQRQGRMIPVPAE